MHSSRLDEAVGRVWQVRQLAGGGARAAAGDDVLNADKAKIRSRQRCSRRWTQLRDGMGEWVVRGMEGSREAWQRATESLGKAVQRSVGMQWGLKMNTRTPYDEKRAPASRGVTCTQTSLCVACANTPRRLHESPPPPLTKHAPLSLARRYDDTMAARRATLRVDCEGRQQHCRRRRAPRGAFVARGPARRDAPAEEHWRTELQQELGPRRTECE
jgi:hypothetical protein